MIIRLRRLSVQRDVPILSDIDWSVRAGEHWAVLGANGSGKTSLVCALAGYVTPSDGEMTVMGRTYGRWDWRELRRHIGLVSAALEQKIEADETALNAVLSGGRAMINFWGQATPQELWQARRILRDVECAPLSERSWGVLSQGERQRVLIGRALMAGPKLLILDEPCAGLDPVARETFLAFLTRLARGRRAPGVVLVTHHLEEIMPLFTHALILKSGRVLARGPIATTLTSPLLSQAFGSRIKVLRSGARYSLEIKAGRRLIA